MEPDAGQEAWNPAPPDVSDRGEDAFEHPTPGLRSFVIGRIASANGIVAALYLGLSVWVLLNPRRAKRLWRRLGGE